jgi:hypothetical protein
MHHPALVRVTAFVKGLALLHFQGLLKQMQDSLTTRRTKAIQEKMFDLSVNVESKKIELKGVSSKPSGKLIVAPIFCF